MVSCPAVESGQQPGQPSPAVPGGSV